MELHAYQRIGIDWLVSRPNGRGILGDEMGLGKTVQALVAGDRVRKQGQFIHVVCPAFLQEKWQAESRKWNVPNVETYSYEHATKLWETNTALPAGERLVFDEAHYLKTEISTDQRGSPTLTKRTQACLLGAQSWAKQASHVFMLTGTPVESSIVDMLPMLTACWPDCPYLRNQWGQKASIHDLSVAVCNFTFSPRYGHKFQTIRIDKVDQVREMLKGKLLARSADILGDAFPSVTIKYEAIKPEATAELKQAQQQPMMQDALRLIQGGRIKQGWDAKPMSTYRRLMAEAKAPVVAKQLVSEFASGQLDQIVLFAHHRNVITQTAKTLEAAGISVGVIFGDTPMKVRDQRVQAFQAGKIQVILAGIKAGGVGLDLYSANKLAFIEWSSKPSDNNQAIARIRRIGQKRHCYIRFFYAPDGIDDVLVDQRVLALADEREAAISQYQRIAADLVDYETANAPL